MPFKVGDVISVYTDRSFDEKYKFAIVVAESKTNDNFLTVFINSKQANSDYIKNYQPCFELNETRKYLKHRSYIDCYSPEEFLAIEIQNSIDKNPRNKLGEVSEADLNLIKHLIKGCPQITNALKRCYF